MDHPPAMNAQTKVKLKSTLTPTTVEMQAHLSNWQL